MNYDRVLSSFSHKKPCLGAPSSSSLHDCGLGNLNLIITGKIEFGGFPALFNNRFAMIQKLCGKVPLKADWGKHKARDLRAPRQIDFR